tara:strand:- start:82 stop:1515 length:1434 start_codon:yes stop_codon:yes gene_type:complete
VLTHREIDDLLNFRFASLTQGFDRLSWVKDKYLLRKEFHVEGISLDKEQRGINTKHWQEKAYPLNKLVGGDKHDVRLQLYLCARQLGLIDEKPWPENVIINKVVLWFALEKFLVKRIEFIAHHANQPVLELHVLTSPRGVFNFEQALPALLAGPIWFNCPDKTHLIKKVLEQHQDAWDSLQWTMNLSALKKEIMHALGVSTWPRAAFSYYYQDKAVYDAVAHKAQRAPLDCEGGAWPVALDLVAYYFHLFTQGKSFFVATKLIPVVACGQGMNLTKSDDLLDAWYYEHGKKPLQNGEKIVFITCNTMHALTFVKQNIWNTFYLQEAFIQQTIFEKIRFFNEQHLLSLSEIGSDVLIAGPASNDFSITIAFDMLAKRSFHLRSKITYYIQLFAIKHSHETPDVMGMQRMILYNQKAHFALINASIELAVFYFLAEKFIKTAGLFNFVLNVLHKLIPKVFLCFLCMAICLRSFDSILAR